MAAIGTAYVLPAPRTPEAGATLRGGVWIRRDAPVPSPIVKAQAQLRIRLGLTVAGRVDQVHSGAAHMRIRFGVRTDWERTVYGASALAIRVAAWAVHREPVNTGEAWLNYVFDRTDGSAHVQLGGADIAIDVGEYDNGEYVPSALHNTQQSGVVTFRTLPTSYTTTGKPVPMIEIPAQAEDGGGQVTLALANSGQPVMAPGGTLETHIGFQARQLDPQAHASTLVVRFYLPCDEAVVVAVPPLADWPTIKGRSGITEQPGDIEYFALGGGGTGSGGMTSGLGYSWR